MVKGRKVYRAVTSALFFVYPFVIYFLLTRFSVRIAGLFILGVLALNYGYRLLHNPQALKLLVFQAGCVFTLVAIGIWLNRQIYLLNLPAFISAFFLIHFAFSLFHPPSVIEQYARVFQSEMTAAEIDYCRAVTRVWIGFFVLNIAVVEWLIFKDDVASWAIYSGFIAYIIMGMIFFIEFSVRKLKFRRFEDNIPDRIAKWVIEKRTG